MLLLLLGSLLIEECFKFFDIFYQLARLVGELNHSVHCFFKG